MYCPFTKYQDGSLRHCSELCMAYNKDNETCKLIERSYNQICYPEYNPFINPPYPFGSSPIYCATGEPS